jgi:ATP-binding protein involved in chromosome partitioning
VPLLGSVPLEPALREGSDVGMPVVLSHPESESATAIRSIAEAIDGVAPLRGRPAVVRSPLAVIPS